MSTEPYAPVRRFRRVVSSIPGRKLLLPVETEEDQPIPFGDALGNLCPGVMFYELEGRDGKRFWGKRWAGSMAALTAPTRSIEAFLGGLGRRDLCLSVDVSDRYGLIYPFDESLFSCPHVVHYYDRRGYFTAEECRRIEELGDLEVAAEGLPKLPLRGLTDYQFARVDSGLIFLDFEPRPENVSRA